MGHKNRTQDQRSLTEQLLHESVQFTRLTGALLSSAFSIASPSRMAWRSRPSGHVPAPQRAMRADISARMIVFDSPMPQSSRVLFSATSRPTRRSRSTPTPQTSAMSTANRGLPMSGKYQALSSAMRFVAGLDASRVDTVPQVFPVDHGSPIALPLATFNITARSEKDRAIKPMCVKSQTGPALTHVVCGQGFQPKHTAAARWNACRTGAIRGNGDRPTPLRLPPRHHRWSPR